MKAVFISDAHIRDHRDPNLPPLLSFLAQLQGQTDRLYVVGDLFDTWFGFPRVVFNEYVPVLAALCELKRSGVQVVYISGNHDYELRGFITDTLEAEVHDTEMVLEADGRRAFVAHGDMANAQDHKYRRLRRILRARFSRWLGRRLPPSWIWAIGQSLAENYTGDEIARRMPLKKIFDEYAARKLAEGYDAVILGHLHIPAFTEAPGARAYVNLGDWLQWRTFLRWEDGRLSLRRWAWPEAVEQPAEIP